MRNSNLVTLVRLGSQLAAGTVLGDITGELDTPSTAVVVAGRLWVVNPAVQYAAVTQYGVLDRPIVTPSREPAEFRRLPDGARLPHLIDSDV